MTLLGRAVPPILLALEGNRKRVVRLRFNGELVGCDPFLMPGFSAPSGGLFSF